MNIKYMEMALKEAEIAFEQDEVPIGCVIVKDDMVLACGHNLKQQLNSSLAHAEIVCINEACNKINSKYLDGCDLYVSLETCMMCMGAIIQSRIANVYYAASDPKGGFCHSVIHVNEIRNLNHYPKLYEGYMKEDSARLLKLFFKMKRLNKQP